MSDLKTRAEALRKLQADLAAITAEVAELRRTRDSREGR